MWKKPNQLHESYTGHGFEVTVGPQKGSAKGSPLTAAGVLESWKGSKGHRDVILGNPGKNHWDKNVKKMGCFINEAWANCWFSKGSDANDI